MEPHDDMGNCGGYQGSLHHMSHEQLGVDKVVWDSDEDEETYKLYAHNDNELECCYAVRERVRCDDGKCDFHEDKELSGNDLDDILDGLEEQDDDIIKV